MCVKCFFFLIYLRGRVSYFTLEVQRAVVVHSLVPLSPVVSLYQGAFVGIVARSPPVAVLVFVDVVDVIATNTMTQWLTTLNYFILPAAQGVQRVGKKELSWNLEVCNRVLRLLHTMKILQGLISNHVLYYTFPHQFEAFA